MDSQSSLSGKTKVSEINSIRIMDALNPDEFQVVQVFLICVDKRLKLMHMHQIKPNFCAL